MLQRIDISRVRVNRDDMREGDHAGSRSHDTVFVSVVKKNQIDDPISDASKIKEYPLLFRKETVRFISNLLIILESIWIQ